MSASPQQLQFLILGTARSGTTLVQRLCCELPGVWVPRETHYWSIAEEAVELFEFPVRGPDRLKVVQWMLDKLDAVSLAVEPEQVMREIHLRRRRVGLFTIFESIVAAMSPERPILGEKTPSHIAWWEPLTHAQPNLKIVFVVRDPRSVLASHRTVPWGSQDPYVLAERWLLHQRGVVDASLLLESHRVLTLRYEDVVTRPRETQTKLASFLDVIDSPSPIPTDLLRTHALFAKSEKWKENALEPVTLDRVRSWETSELDHNDITVTESVCAELMERFSYTLTTDSEPGTLEASTRAKILAYRRTLARISSHTNLPIY